MNTVTVTLRRIGGTPKAYLFSRAQNTMPTARGWWIPRSIIIKLIQLEDPSLGNWPKCEVTLPAWFATKKRIA